LQRAVDHGGQGLRRAENTERLGPPGPPLLGVGPRLVLGLAGLQRGLLRELDGLDRPGWAAVPGLELPGELTAPTSIINRRADQVLSSRSSTPTISRTARLPGSPARSVNPTPSLSRSKASSRVLYRSDAATVSLCSGRPSRASQRPSASPPTAWTLLLTATWVCRLGSPARLSRCVNAAAIRPRTSTCRAPPRPRRV